MQYGVWTMYVRALARSARARAVALRDEYGFTHSTEPES